MNIPKIRRRLQEEWERGVERAQEETLRAVEPDAEQLAKTAGLAVKARIKSGKSSIEGCGLTIQY